ncbi:YhcH/YjgK/YiaL family protein [Sediminibacterium sp. KACHI17]|jgi:YhcH/YjgK/YiaL family protein|uniref:YhcH/YjgK/YiaL family protein n=1 Tax=Sediminibacterium sp. KACHI17 TaxID=1751071 RepID=A0AAT9GFT3_9BACT
MVIDHISRAALYFHLHPGIETALRYIQTTDFTQLENGKYELDGEQLFAIVQAYDTKDPDTEKLEAHKKFIDVQYVVSGQEKMGHALLSTQVPSREYQSDDDFMLFDETPDFFTVVTAGMFTIFYPSDLHMPCIIHERSTPVKKVVVKVSVDYVRDKRQSL